MLRNNVRIIKEFLRHGYTDEKLANLLSFAELGLINWHSIQTCFVGLSSMRGRISGESSEPAIAYLRFQKHSGFLSYGVEAANKKMVPLIKAEIARRDEGKNLTYDLLRSFKNKKPEAISVY